MTRWLLSLCPLAALLLTSCAGYQLNGSKPSHLVNVTKLYVPTFENSTLEPRLAVLVTNAVIKQLQADGSYQIVREDEAEATLKGKIADIDRSQWRSVRTNTLKTRELLVRLKTDYRVVDNTGAKLHSGRVHASSYLVLDPNWQTSERQAISEASERMAVALANELCNGW